LKEKNPLEKLRLRWEDYLKEDMAMEPNIQWSEKVENRDRLDYLEVMS